jgi:hypothetical protein
LRAINHKSPVHLTVRTRIRILVVTARGWTHFPGWWKELEAARIKPRQNERSITAHYANEPSLSDQAPPMQRATINQLSSETALPNRSRIAECRRKSQNIVALAGFASGRAPAVREPAAFIFCLPSRRLARAMARRHPKADLTDVDCRAARPKFNIGDGPLALFGSRTKLMQHWADRIDHWLDPKKAMPIKGGAQA